MEYFETREQLSELIVSGKTGIFKHTESNFEVELLPLERTGKYSTEYDSRNRRWHTILKLYTEPQYQKAVLKLSKKVAKSAKKLWS